MRRVCCACNTVLDPGEGPEDQTTHTYCTPCYFVECVKLEQKKEPTPVTVVGSVDQPSGQERVVA